MSEVAIGNNDLFIRKRGNGIARINFTSADGAVSYRLVGSRRTYYVTRESFLKNWKPLETSRAIDATTTPIGREE